MKRAFLMLAGAACVLAACSDDEGTSSTAPSTTSIGPGAGAGGAGAGGGSGGSTSTSTSAGGAGAGIPDTPCEDPAQAAVEVYGSGSNLQLRELVHVGTRFMASGNLGYVRFDEDGGNPDAMPTQLGSLFNTLSDEDGAVGLAAGSTNAVIYQRHDGAGAITGPRVLENVQSTGATSALAGSDTVVIWGWNGQLNGRVVDAAGDIAGDMFLVKSGAYGGSLRLRAVNGPDSIGLAWFGSPNAGFFYSWFLQVDASGPMGTAELMYDTGLQHELQGIVAVEGGFVVLVTGPPPEVRPHLIHLNTDGIVTQPPIPLAGATQAHGIASQGASFAVVAGRESGEPELRVFDASLEPVASWVCLGASHNITTPAAITKDGSGYAVIFETTDGAVMLSRVGADGTGAP